MYKRPNADYKSDLSSRYNKATHPGKKLSKRLASVFRSGADAVPQLDKFFKTTVGHMRQESNRRLISANVRLRQVLHLFVAHPF